ncbi:MAG: aldo/keto reductase [Candidatus Omnitrophota bacterium]|nr:aldo/keto reductase [Candidatus Omnitrophota bacterium]
MIDRLVLGVVQLGMPYGINNKIGKPDFNSACDIVKTAFDNGITRFDTAQAYGDSEEILGNVFDKLKINKKVKVYSKLDPKLNLCDEFAVQQSVEDSLCKLKINQLEGLLLHHEDSLNYWDKGLGSMLQGLVTKGKVKLVGASFYSPQKAFDALDIDGIDIIQVPANILDRRFENVGVFKKAKECNKDVFVRSVFLQGLLLMPLACVPVSMKYVLPYLEQLEKMAFDLSLNRQELVLRYAGQRWPGSFVLFGAETMAQVIDNLRIFSKKIILSINENIFKNIPENILNPMFWPKL